MAAVVTIGAPEVLIRRLRCGGIAKQPAAAAMTIRATEVFIHVHPSLKSLMLFLHTSKVGFDQNHLSP